MVNLAHSFHLADYLIFSVTIFVSLGIGVYYALSGGKQRTTSEYFVGNRKMSMLPVAISLMVSFESSIMMLGTPAEVYVYGFQWFIGNVGFTIANILSIIIVVPLVHPLRITSAYEYLELRFNSRAVRLLGTILGMLSYTAYMGIVLFGPAIALEGVTGLPQYISIVSVALASVIYTAIGGLKAVIWTDVFQCLVMFSGLFAVMIKGTIDIGGIGKTWEIAYAKGRVNIFNFDPDPTVRHTFWNLFVGSIIRGLGLVFNQSSIQRICSTPTLPEAKKVLMLVTPGFFLSITFAGIEGIISYAYYDTKGCDPLASKQISNPNQIIPYMVMDIFHNLPGMPGLFMASLFSASLSTLSSGLGSMSALFWTDLVKPHVKPMSELRATILSKISVFVFGGLAILIAFLIDMVGGTLVQISGSLLSAFSGPLAGLFMFGAFCPWGNAKGAFWGSVISAVTTFIISIGQMTTKGSVKNTKLPSGPTDMCPADIVVGLVANSTWPPFNDTMMTTVAEMISSTMAAESLPVPEPQGFRRLFMLSYKWFGAVGILQTMVFGTLISFCTGRKMPGEVERKYLIPFYDSLFPFLPESLLKILRCGYDHTKYEKKPLSDDAAIDEDGLGKNIFNQELVINDADESVQNDKATFITVQPHSVLDNGQATQVANGHVVADAEIGEEANDVTKSIDDVRPVHFPQVRDMEINIMQTGNDATDGNDPSKLHDQGFIVVDKTQDTPMLRKSMEIIIQAEALKKSAEKIASEEVLPDMTVIPISFGDDEKADDTEK